MSLCISKLKKKPNGVGATKDGMTPNQLKYAYLRHGMNNYSCKTLNNRVGMSEGKSDGVRNKEVDVRYFQTTKD